MTRALLAKELRQLTPIGLLWLSVLVLGYAVRLFTERVDEESFASWCEGFCERGGNAPLAAFSILFALVTAYALFPREHDEGTIDYLRALPVSRGRIFATKVFAAWLLLCTVNVASYSLDALMLAASPESLGGRFVGQVWWTLLWRDCVFAFVILAHGVLLSWFRVAGLIVYALYVLLLLWYESRIGPVGLLSVFGMLVNDYDGQRLIVDARAILVHVGLACVLLAIGQRLWGRTASAERDEVRAPGRAARALRVLAATLAVAVLVPIAFRDGDTPVALEVVETAHYRFAHRPEDAEVVAYVAAVADADLERIGTMLGAETLPFVRVDLSGSSEHAAGLAKWKKIRMDLDAFDADVSQRRVLAHEATHVMQSILSDRALGERFASVRFFVEGMAQHVSFEVVPEPGRRADNHALAAVARARQDIDFADLVDDAAFSARFDPELYYSLGDLWTLALVDVCGERVLGDFLRAAGREGAPSSIGGETFWRDTFGVAECSLDAVNTAWDTRMRAAYGALDRRRFPAFDDIVVAREEDGALSIAARLRAADEEDGMGGVLSADDPDDIVRPVRAVVRVADEERLGAGADPVFRGTLAASEEGGTVVTFRIPAASVPGWRMRYQLGYEPDGAAGGDSRVYYEGWRSAIAPR